MGRVTDVLKRKGCEVHTLDRDATVYDALRRMVERNVGSLVVTEDGAPVGIFTERDFLRRIALQGRDPRTTKLWEVMTERLICVEPERPVEECMSIMTQERVRHLPVLDRGELAGLVSIGDLVRHLSDERHVEVCYLTDYIVGRYPA